MKKVSCLVFVFICLVSGMAQTPNGREEYGVRGLLLDSLTNQPEMYVTLRIYKAGTSSVSGTLPLKAFVSDEQGRFRSPLPAAGSYRLEATRVGKEVVTKTFTLSSPMPFADLGTLWMKEDVRQLDEVSVVAARPLVKIEVDKTVYNIEDDPDTPTSTLIEMLRKVPLVSVDGDERIRVNGNTSFRIYMNGKPSNMLSNNPSEVLRSIPAHTIKKIEVITDPGARFDAEGVSGILNIVTKSAELEGYTVNLNTILTNRTKVAGGFASVKYGRLALSGTYSFNEYRYKSKDDYERYQTNLPDEANFHTYSDIKTKSPGHYAGVEGSYEIDSLNMLSVWGAVDLSRNKENHVSTYRMEDSSGQPVYAYRENKTSRQKRGSGAFKMDYQHLSRQEKERVLTLSYQYDYSPDDRNTLSSRFDRQGDSPSLQYIHPWDRQINRAKRHEHTFQLDYVTPLPRFFSVADRHLSEGGVKYIRRNNLSKATSFTRGEETADWEPSLLQPVLDYRHIQNILAAYAGYRFKKGKWTLYPGLRMEHTWQTVEYREGEGEDFEYKITDWVPSFSASYKMNERNQWQAAYNLRVRRPGIQYLNPYVLIGSSSIEYGNPALTSEKRHRWTLAYHYFSAKLNLQARALYTSAKGSIGSYQFMDENGIVNSTYDNIEDVQAGGITFYAGLHPSPYTNLSVNGQVNYVSLRAKTENIQALAGRRNGGWCTMVYMNFSQRFARNWHFSTGGGFARPEPTLGTDPYNYYFYSLNLSKNLLDDKLTLALRMENLLTRYVTLTSKETYPDFQAVTKSRLYRQEIGISVSYRFGNLKTSVRKALRSIRNDDLLNKEK